MFHRNDRDFVFFLRNTWIPEGARCCSSHLIGHQLSEEAIDAIKPFAIRASRASLLMFNFF